MIAILVAFILGSMGLFIGLMLLGVLIHIWPLLVVLSLWGIVHDLNKERRKSLQEGVARPPKVW